MNHEAFDQLVREVETSVGRNQTALRWRTIRLALIGYAGLLAWFLLVVLISAGFFSAMLWTDFEGKIVCGIAGSFVLGFGGWFSLQILLVKLPPPKGTVVSRDTAPALFVVLDELQKETSTVPFHEVMLTSEFNAGVVQVPRLGIFGWPRNYLLIGLPLLDGLSPDEMRAVLAHEFTHLSRRHGHLSHWLYRLRRSWEELFQRLSHSRVQGTLSLRPLTIRFVDWFWPRFNAHAFVLSRANEYEADAQAARLAGGQHLASALVRLQILSRLIDQQLWPDIWRLTQVQPSPPANVFVRLRDGLKSGADEEHRSRWTDEAFNSASTNSDTHPCLSERLRALGVPLIAPANTTTAASPAAAEILLGDALDGFRHDVQEYWQRESSPQWTGQHTRAAALSHRLASLDQAVPAGSVNVESLWDKAHVLLNLRDRIAAEPLLREILLRQSDHAPANFQLGLFLLENGKDDGVVHLERAMTANSGLVPQACNLLHEHYRKLGQTEQIRALATRLDRHEKELTASRAERTSITAKDRFLSHGLSASELEALRRTLATEPDLAGAELAQKELKYFAHDRLFVLCVRRRPAWHQLPDTEADRAIARRLSQSVHLPGRVLVFPPSGSFRSLARKLRHFDAVWP